MKKLLFSLLFLIITPLNPTAKDTTINLHDLRSALKKIIISSPFIASEYESKKQALEELKKLENLSVQDMQTISDCIDYVFYEYSFYVRQQANQKFWEDITGKVQKHKKITACVAITSVFSVALLLYFGLLELETRKQNTNHQRQNIIQGAQGLNANQAAQAAMNLSNVDQLLNKLSSTWTKAHIAYTSFCYVSFATLIILLKIAGADIEIGKEISPQVIECFMSILFAFIGAVVSHGAIQGMYYGYKKKKLSKKLTPYIPELAL